MICIEMIAIKLISIKMITIKLISIKMITIKLISIKMIAIKLISWPRYTSGSGHRHQQHITRNSFRDTVKEAQQGASTDHRTATSSAANISTAPTTTPITPASMASFVKDCADLGALQSIQMGVKDRFARVLAVVHTAVPCKEELVGSKCTAVRYTSYTRHHIH
jgi:hypothetical protein